MLWPFDNGDEFKDGDILVAIGHNEKWVVSEDSDIGKNKYKLCMVPLLIPSDTLRKDIVESNFVKVGRWHWRKNREVDDDDQT